MAKICASVRMDIAMEETQELDNRLDRKFRSVSYARNVVSVRMVCYLLKLIFG